MMSIRSWILFGVFVLIMGLMDYTLCKMVSRDDIKEEDNDND